MVAVTEETRVYKDIKTAVGGVVDTVNKRVSGKAWKIQKTPTIRAQKAKTLRRTWEQRSAERTRDQTVKALERQLKDEKKAEKDRKREITQERRKIQEEKERMELLATKMNAKRLARVKKRELRKKARV
ncbi:Cgr1 family-domain-containing protein [Phycomyces blakesleeanus]|uniref:rRNA-processing protein n=2 Tax=Phycomyces blakesleeanus TaxID=4837 RepID=A0A167LC25_PHYB8|nr:hypothetical protein PHYBLDRAFT_80109 [Phycomyces blakesleeanus NRRL 1555(-)]OAD70098.1 hypothetical protein PHYBLDRAFT_80109 [Phycomyces blakesleeanus NRRL 1555(-)]|eukprot:XP_018288138.1 hypothetical protein PHYBLDRAFT_80109 [Phycomyces blakesleeanus NRRL 1555(-)]